MRLSKIKAALAAIVLLSVLSCAKREYSGTGYLTVSLGMGDPSEITVKSPEAPDDDMIFSLSIVGDDGVHSYSVADYRTLATEPLAVAAGWYTVTAYSGSDNAAAWGSPYYSGSQRILVKPERTNTVNITCTLANTMVTVEFTDPIPELFSDYRVIIENGNGETLTFAKNNGTVNNTGYYAVTGTLTYTLIMVNSDGMQTTIGPNEITGVQANQHYHFKFSMADESAQTGGFTLTIIVDEDTVYNEYKLKMNFGLDGKPITNTDFPLTNVITVIEGSTESHKATFLAERGIASLVLHHADAGLLAVGLPQWTDLVTTQVISSVTDLGIACNVVDWGATEAEIDFTTFISRLPIGDYSFTTTVIDTENAYNEVRYNLSVISPIDAQAVSAKAWAEFAMLKGRWFAATMPAGVRIQYKKTSESVWHEPSASDYVVYDNAAKTVYAEVYGLAPNTQYVFRTVSDKDEDTGEIAFTTGSALTIPNLGFDNWYQDGSAWIPNASSSNYVWDSANPGVASIAGNPTVPEESDVVRGKAAKLTALVAYGQLAAGNIYTGKFGRVNGLGADLKWGYAFTSKPIALRGWMKYTPATINKTKAPYTSLNGTTDQCSIKMYLTDWSSQFSISTSSMQFLAEDDDSIIAAGALYSSVRNSGYVQFTIPFEYRDLERNPSYIVVMASSCRYADYFTGGEGSTLLVDEFELIYDPAELTEAERQLVGYRD